MTLCNRCGHEWFHHTENAVCVDLFGACLWHRRETLTDAEREKIRTEYQRRNAVQHIEASHYGAPKNGG